MNLEEAQQSLAEEEEKERAASRLPTGTDKGGPSAPAAAPPEKKPQPIPPPPPAAKTKEETRKVEPATHAELQPAAVKEHAAQQKYVRGVGPDLQTAYQRNQGTLAQQVRDLHEISLRQFALVRSALENNKEAAPVPFYPVPREAGPAIELEPRHQIVAPQIAPTVLLAPRVSDPPPAAPSSWSERLGWLLAGGLACFSLFTVRWSLRRRIRGTSRHDPA